MSPEFDVIEKNRKLIKSMDIQRTQEQLREIIDAAKQSPTATTMMDVTETCRFFGGANSPLNPATLYRGIKSGKYPRPVKLGAGTSRWLRSECEEALRKLIAKRDSKDYAA